tara:strand:+ start:189 stop:635 length:447 start_codon:yes stop_codon:yes gene_type:complete
VNKNELKAECYSLYAQGLKYREIAEAVGSTKSTVEKYVSQWARDNSLPFPLDRGYNKFAYDLYMNKMPVKDIARFLEKTEIQIYKSIHRYCKKYNLNPPFKDKTKLAYVLRQKNNFTYERIAEITGFHDKSSCYRAIKNYEKKLEKEK